MDILKKVGYVRGFMEGLKIDEKTDEGKLLSKIVDLLDDVCQEIKDLKVDLEASWDMIDDMDRDLAELEEEVFGDCCDDVDDVFCVKCPDCGEEHYLRYDMLTDDELETGKIKCPSCKAEIDIDDCLVDEEQGCSCGCGKSDCKCDDGDCK